MVLISQIGSDDEILKSTNNIFMRIFADIDSMLINDFYEEKEKIRNLKIIIKKWFDKYLEKNTLKVIKANNLEFVQFEILDLFDKYIWIESVKENYVERLMFDFSILEKKWKEAMLRDEK